MHCIPSGLDKDIWGEIFNLDERAIAVAAGFAKAGSRSHVLLAAFREVEKSHEANGRGEFTRVLLDTLRSVATDKLTYRDLMQRIPDIPEYVHQFNKGIIFAHSLLQPDPTMRRTLHGPPSV